MIEINLTLLKDERGTHEGYVTVHRKNGLTFQRKQRLGQKSKIELLPEHIKNEIIELRKLGDSGNSIKSQIQNMIDIEPENIRNKLFKSGFIDEDGKIKISGQTFSNYAASKGIETRNKRQQKTVQDPQLLNQLKQIEEKNIRLEIELKELKDLLQAEKKAHYNARKRMTELKLENFKLKNELEEKEKKVKLYE